MAERLSEDARLVLQASRRHVWVCSSEAGETCEEVRLRVLGAVDLVPGDLVVPDGNAVRRRIDRRSVLRRRTSRGEQVLAANIEDLLVITGAGMAEGGEGLIARCIAAAKAENISPVLIFNKVDIDESGDLRASARAWERLGFDAHVVSAVSGEGLDLLSKRLEGRSSALVGVSGVGKSTLINAMTPSAGQRTAEVSDQGRGRHTTSLGRAIRWKGGLLIDLPGVRSFGLFDYDALNAAYPDIERAAERCRFSDCTHGPEPDCAVKDAASRSEIEPERLSSWHRVRQSITEGREGVGRATSRLS